MPVVVLQSAKNDLLDGYLFCERQGGSYRGTYIAGGGARYARATPGMRSKNAQTPKG